MAEFLNHISRIIQYSAESIYLDLAEKSGQMLVVALILIVVTGYIGGMTARKLKQPLVIGYILAGIVTGILIKLSFGNAANESLDSLAEIGVALLLFSMGLEFPKKDIMPIKGIAVWGSMAQVLFTFAAASVIGYILNCYTKFLPQLQAQMLFGACFVSTSTAVLIKTLVSRNRMETLSSKVMIGISIVQDLTVIPLVLLVTQLGNFSNFRIASLKPLGLGAVFMTFMLTIGAGWFHKILRHTAKYNSKELFLLAETGIALTAGALFNLIDLSFSFGAFLAGIALSDSDYGKKALSEVMPVRDLFAMLFFVSIGMMLDTSFFSKHVLLVLGLTVATGLSRTVFLSVVSYFAKYRNVIPVAMLFGMLSTSEIAFVVIQTGRKAGIFSDNAYSLVLCIVVCSMLLGPLADALTAPVYSFLKRTIWKDMKVPGFTLPPSDLTDHLMIAGGGLKMGEVFQSLFQNRTQSYLLIEPLYREFKKIHHAHIPVLFGDPQSSGILESGGIKRAKLFLAAFPEFEDNLLTIKAVRELNPEIMIITRAETQEEAELLEPYHIYQVISPKLEGALEMARRALLCLNLPQIEAQNTIDRIRYGQQNNKMQSGSRVVSYPGLIRLRWFILPEHSVLTGKSIAQSAVRTETGVSIAGLIRKQNSFANPGPDTVLCAKDTVGIIGTPDQISKFEEWVGVAGTEAPSGDAEETHD